MIKQITDVLTIALQSIGVTFDGMIDLDSHPSFGDYSSNVAMKVFPAVQKEQWNSPRALAQTLMDVILKSKPDWLDRVEVAGPGFINFWLTDTVLQEHTLQSAQDPSQFIDKVQNEKVVVEFSSPNIAKPFTVGHLRSTIIGAAVANLLEIQGWTVFRDNHLGDWGTQFGKLIAAIKKWPELYQEIETADKPVEILVNLYIKFHAEAEKDPTLEDEGRAWFKKLEDGDPEARALWQKCIDWSWKEFNRIYLELGIDTSAFENNGKGYGESYFEDKMQPVIDELKTKGLLHDGKDGAQIIEFGEKMPPLMILKKDGATLYATRDLATDKFRREKYGADITIVNEVGIEQSLYFQQLFTTEELLGWYKPGQRIHIGHGFFRLKEGKMSTRKGNVIWLEDVLQEAITRATKLAAGASESAKQVGIGALKWNDLKRSAHLDVIFDWDDILNMQGNSGPYIQYTAVRCNSVLEKAHFEADTASIKGTYQLNEEERSVAVKLHKFGLVIADATKEFAPHYLCTYLYELAQSFNAFYNKHKIIEEGKPNQYRIELTLAVKNTLETGLRILGIQTPERM